MSIGAYYLLRETPEERAERLASEQADYEETINQAEEKFGINIPDDAKNLEVRESGADYAFLCDGDSDGDLLEFDTSLSKKEINKFISDSLGPGSAEYTTFEDYGSWNWRVNERSYGMTIYGFERGISSVTICMTRT